MYKELTERVRREKESYDLGKIGAENIFALIPSLDCINQTPARRRFGQLISDYMKSGKYKVLLELGSQAWTTWMDFDKYPPQELVCINISESQLAKGVEASIKKIGLEHLIDFQIMDAHSLKFPDATFDLVFGGSILHHLNIETAIKEIYRVLKPGGIIIFEEPLIHNPVGKIVRLLTPQARTLDERPLGVKELRVIDQYFITNNYYTQLLDVPCSIISTYFFKNQDNLLTRFSDKIDSFLVRLPYLKYLYRTVLVYGIKK